MYNEQVSIVTGVLSNKVLIGTCFDCELQPCRRVKEPREFVGYGGQRDNGRGFEGRVDHRKEDGLEVESQVKTDVEIKESIYIPTAEIIHSSECQVERKELVRYNREYPFQLVIMV